LAKQKIYSPNQVLAVSFLGGPMAMVYALWKNFRTLGDAEGMHHILFWGSIFVVALMLFAPLMPSSLLDYALPFAFSFAARAIAERHQLSKQAIAESEIYEFESVWNIIAVSLIFLIAMMVTAIVWFSALAMIGLI
jgi:hypothetical protein